MKRSNTLTIAVGGLLVCGMLCAPTLGQTVVTAGDDAWLTSGPGTEFSFGNTAGPAIPADFFGPGSDPFEGTIALTGNPVCSVPPGVLEATDTIVRRLTDTGDLDQGPQVVDVEIIALSLVSIEPITVTFNGGQNPEDWDVEVHLSSTVPQPTGSMTITKTHENGGVFESSFKVVPSFVFTHTTLPSSVELDCGPNVGSC